ncbi:hypothetical protein H6P81_012023 [Aristolochia fimbriata]|uniref:HMA domain-containing protein n=1 Tax=Aristolochia fimbriata TaxID=158543 RepID=A0AAV7EAM2_ARIFI|nr:hypothetical protein H6P81_012023 [Aristolochia fimbriata]
MGEEEKKPEENKVEEKKAEEEKKPPAAATEEKKEEAKEKEEKGAAEEKEAPPPPPPPPEEIVLRVFMHCEGCARKVKRCLRGFDGVEEVQTDCKTHKVVVKGKKAAADPLKVLDRVQRKSHRKVELLTPLPKPPAEAPKPEPDKPKPEEKKEEPPVMTVVLKVHMHCEACAQEIRKRILKMKGVQEADPDLKGSEVRVKGVFEASKLVEYVYKRTGKHAVVVKQEVEKKEEEKAKEEKEEKGGEGEKEKGGGEGEGKGEKKEGGGGEEAKEGGGDGGDAVAAAAGGGGGEEETKTEAKKHEFIYYSSHPRYYTEYQRYPMESAYPPQIFSDENPNACSVM